MFKGVWMPVTRQSLQVRNKTCNKHASYAVATPYKDTILSPRVRSRCRNCPCIYRLKHVNYLSCLAEIRGNFTYLSVGVSKNKWCRIFIRNTVYPYFLVVIQFVNRTGQTIAIEANQVISNE